MYAPTRDAEWLLVNVLVQGVLSGVSALDYHGTKLRYLTSLQLQEQQTTRTTQQVFKVRYSNISVAAGTFSTYKVWDVICDVDVVQAEDDSKVVQHAKRLWLASIPRLNDEGLLEIGKTRCYSVMRQRLLPNVPIATIHREAGRDSVICVMRSENHVTLESVFLQMRRSSRGVRTVVIATHITGFKPVDAVGYIRSLLRAQDWQEAIRWIFEKLGATSTVMAMLQLLMINIAEVQSYRYLLPGSIGTDANHYSTLVSDYTVSSEALLLCQMLLRFLRVEAGEIPPDDRDDCANKVVDSYAILMGKLFRKLVLGLGIGVVPRAKIGEPLLFRELLDAYVKNSWSVVEEYNSDMQITRGIEYTGAANVAAAQHEVVILANTSSTGGTFGEVFDVRMVHPSQRGFLCMLRTADDTNAGLKLYLASDCRISTSQYLFGISRDDDNARLRELLSRCEPLSEVFWVHNSNLVGLGGTDNIVHLLKELKMQNREVSWNLYPGVIESRCCYGRFLCTSATYGTLDSREVDCYAGARDCVSNFSLLCHEVVYMNRMPPARAMLSTKIMQKCITAHPPPPHEMHSSDYSHLCYAQSPLVTTTKASSFCYGYNAVVCYATLQGYGIEDGIIVNRASVERGLFMIVKRFSMIWTLREKCTATEYVINARVGDTVKEGAVLAVFTCEDENGTTTVTKLKHCKPYQCKVADIDITFNTGKAKGTGMIDPRFLAECSVTLVRCKRFRTGDKLSSRSGQKAVAVRLMDQCDMPMIHTLHAPSGAVIREPPPTVDIIVNPLSLVSRCTVSQSISSMLGMLVTGEGAVAVETPFTGTEIVYRSGWDPCTGETRYPLEVNKMRDYSAVLLDGATGTLLTPRAAVGIEYYMVLSHVADEKVRISSASTYSQVGGSLGFSESGNYVKYNWQELSALLHAKAYKLLDEIYLETGNSCYYPYCSSCDRDTEPSGGTCCVCGSNITHRVQASRSFVTAERLSKVLFVDMSIQGKESDS